MIFIQKIKPFLFEPRFHFNRFQFNLVALFFITVGFIAGSYLTLKGIINTFAAGDTSTTWNFSISSDYTLSDSSLVEITGNTTRLKANNYTSDANTVLLYHLDESSGTSVTDSSSNSNTGTASSAAWTTGNLNNGLQLNGTTTYISASDSSSLSLSQQNTIEAWTKFDSNFSSASHSNDQGIVDKGAYKLYYDHTTGKINYELADSTTTSWTQQAGKEIKDSWDTDGKFSIDAQVVVGTDIYVGLGTSISQSALNDGDAEVWKFDTINTTWTQVGGDGVNSSWPDSTYELVVSLATDGTNIYAGLGWTGGDGEVWKYNGSSWTKIGGDNINSGWSTYAEYVMSLVWAGGNLYAGLGSSTGDADVWKWNGTSWTQIGGDGLNSGWAASVYEYVPSLVTDGTYVYAGLGGSTGDAEVWRYNIATGTWTKIGGDAVNSSWADAAYEYLPVLLYSNSVLYAGLGNSTGDAEVWRWNGTSWTQIGGDGLNSSWAASVYEIVTSLVSDGTDIYAGLGFSTNDDEVWKFIVATGTWTKIGGDAINSGFPSPSNQTHSTVTSMSFLGSNLYAGISAYSWRSGGNNTSVSSEFWKYNGSTWTILGGNYINNSWGYSLMQNISAMTVSGGYLYAGTGWDYGGNALVWKFDGSTWTRIGGQGLNSGWAARTYELVYSMADFQGNLYVGLGYSSGDAEVWKWNGTSWTQVGGDSLNSGWTTGYEVVYSLAVYNGELYAGLGNSVNDSEVWKWNGTSWTKVGGDGINSSWNTSYETVQSMAIYGGNLYAGLGNSTGDAEVWSYNGSSWTKIGGDGINSGWNTGFEQVYSLIGYNGNLYAGLGNGIGDGEVWKYNGSSWTKIGGDAVNSSWADLDLEIVYSLAQYNGDLYAGIGNNTGDGEVWKYNGSSWTQIGGDGLNSGFGGVTESVRSLTTYKGKLYAGTGDSVNFDANIWSYGSNAILQSTTITQDTNWHHITGSYDGSTMKLYIDGTLDNSTSVTITLPDTPHSLLSGTTYSGLAPGFGQGYFAGLLDEIRISSTARGSFTTYPYATSGQTVQPSAAVMTTGIKNWENFTASESANGGTITYRLSSDNGTTWKYWTGSSWGTSSSISQANSASDIDTNISSFTVGSGGILWQAILTGNGNQRVTLNSITINATSDTTAPATNASSITMTRSSSGTSVSSNGWTNNSSPYFSWTAGADNSGGAGLKGYCLYLGTDSSGDPATSKGLLGTSPVSTSGTTCQFIISATSIDFATSSYQGSTWLSTSNDPFYLNIKAVDNAGNIFTGSSTQFQFRFDNTAPTNVSYIYCLAGSFSNVVDMSFSWPTSGSAASSDSNAGLLGWQYQINSSSGTWLGTTTESVLGVSNYIPTSSSSRVLTQSQDGSSISSGNNIIYFRAADAAGNVSSTIRSCTITYGGAAPSFDSSATVTVTPSSSTSNSYALSWPVATPAAGQSVARYYYMINTPPPSTLATLQGNSSTYIDNGTSRTVSATALPNVNKGSNTIYIVAIDDASTPNYSPSNYITGSFTLSSTDPDNVGSLMGSDSSIKSSSIWNVTLTWTAPSYQGAGNLTYLIYRSTDGASFSQVGSTTGLSYVDNAPSSRLYYYKVYTRDGANATSSGTNAVSVTPTGKWTSAPSIDSGPSAGSITTKKATITWSTSRTSDSKVQYGTKSGSYSTVEPGNSSQITSHSIQLTGLNPGTTYYYKAKWTDEDGNTGTSEEKSFTTAAAPTVKDPQPRHIGLMSAIINYTVKDASKVKIYYGKTSAFGGSIELSTSTSETNYSTEIHGLEDGTKYYYKINTLDSEGSEYEGNILSFETFPRPKITKIRIAQVVGTAQPTVLVSWNTNTEISSIITYYPSGNPSLARDEINVALAKNEHQMLLKGLDPRTTYQMTIKGRDIAGNEAISDTQTFTTATDTRPPELSEVTIESSIVPNLNNSQQVAQLVVTWNTDKPATSQVEFGEGTGSTYNQKTQQDNSLTFNHLVIISNLTPSKVYHLRAISVDKSGNIGKSIDNVTIAPKAMDNALNLVITNLQQALGISVGGQK